MSDVENQRIHALKRFAAALTLFVIVGREGLGFEGSWLQAAVSIGTGMAVVALLETVGAWLQKRENQLLQSKNQAFFLLLPAYIAPTSVSFLLYCGDALAPFAFGAGAAMCSKYMFRAPFYGRSRHYLNPACFGICVALLFLPNTSAAPPYQYMENIGVRGELILFLFICYAGSFINIVFTNRFHVFAGFLGGFFLQAVLRSFIQGNSMLANLLPMTGLAFFLFAFYMVTDPATSPSRHRDQIIFGGATSLLYGVLQYYNIVFGLFYALTLVCAVRGLWAYWKAWTVPQDAQAPFPA